MQDGSGYWDLRGVKDAELSSELVEVSIDSLERVLPVFTCTLLQLTPRSGAELSDRRTDTEEWNTSLLTNTLHEHLNTGDRHVLL